MLLNGNKNLRVNLIFPEIYKKIEGKSCLSTKKVLTLPNQAWYKKLNNKKGGNMKLIVKNTLTNEYQLIDKDYSKGRVPT
jgi:hypothetical protein